ncbi:MAG: deoxyribonuclease IV [Candidatus Omnitrophica bacterium]|nr:deoxyribonuclease IV [Candidatus Omnitrophota bacterium]
MLLGVHISGVPKLYKAFERAKELGCNTLQVFSRNPQQWRHKDLDPEDVEEFRQEQASSNIKPVFVHIPYLINLASPNPRLYKASIEAYVEDIKEVHALGVDYIVTHMGSHKETTEVGGLKRLARALNRIIERTKDTNVGILLENTAGSGSWLGYRFSHHKKVLGRLNDPRRVGLCLDTAHAYSAGYDLAAKEGLERLLGEIDKAVGLSLLRLIHLNDAKAELGSHRDVHEHIGKGKIGLEGIARIINHPGLRDLPFILETPKKEEGDDARNLKTVRKLRRD